MTIKDRIKTYLKKKSPFSIASDVIFILLLIALAFPTTRMAVVSTIQRIALFSPSAKSPESRTTISANAYQWEMTGPSRKQVQLADYKGKVILLNFWATWCPPCVAEMPSIQNLYEDYGDKVVFLLVSNEKPEVINSFKKKKGYTMPVYHSRMASPEEFKTTTIPTTFILSKEGEIVLEKTGAARWSSKKVRSLLDELINQ